MPQRYVGGGGNSSPAITLTKSGLIIFNQPACRLLSIKPGVKVSLAQDEETPENWYVFIDPNGFAVRTGYSKSKGCVMNHSGMVKMLVESVNKDTKQTHRFLIGGEPTVMKGSKTQYWGILIS